MIRFALKCRKGHGFESWFASGSAYETLNNAGEITCPECGSSKVEKDIMAPAVGKSSKGQPDRQSETFASGLSETAGPAEAALVLVEAARRVRAHLEAEGKYVGDDFARQARARHEAAAKPAPETASGKKPPKEPDADKPIWGEATPEEVRDLLEDGIAVLPLPKLPEDNN